MFLFIVCRYFTVLMPYHGASDKKVKAIHSQIIFLAIVSVVCKDTTFCCYRIFDVCFEFLSSVQHVQVLIKIHHVYSLLWK